MVGLFGRIARNAGLVGKREIDSDGTGLAVYGPWAQPTSSGIRVDQYSAMQLAAVMACVSILAEDVAKLPLQIWKMLPNGGKALELDHPLNRLLWSPNGWQTQFEFIELMQAALVLRSNAYAIKIRNGRGEITSLVPINPDRVQLWESPDGSIFYRVTRSGLHEMAVLANVPFMVPAEDMFHLRWLAIGSSLVSTSRVWLMREMIGLGISQEQQAAMLAGSGARPSGVLQTDMTLSEDVAKRLGAEWQQTYGGLKNTGKTIVLEQGMKWQPMGMTSVDAQFIAQREFALNEVARAFRMPPHKIGIIVKGAASTMIQQDQDYMNNVLSSYCTRWEQKIGKEFDLNGTAYRPEFDMSKFLRADIMTRLTALRIGILGMIFTPNEARRSEGLPEVEGGDVLYQPVNVAPIGFDPTAQGIETSAGPGSDITGAPGAGGSGDAGEDVGDTAPSD